MGSCCIVCMYKIGWDRKYDRAEPGEKGAARSSVVGQAQTHVQNRKNEQQERNWRPVLCMGGHTRPDRPTRASETVGFLRPRVTTGDFVTL